jgi:hypothetical protein
MDGSALHATPILDRCSSEASPRTAEAGLSWSMCIPADGWSG